MVNKKDESGYALLYALGLIILVSLMVGTIFFVARTTYMQINEVDRVKTAKEAQEYALKAAKHQIKRRLDRSWDIIETTPLGNDGTKLLSKINMILANVKTITLQTGEENKFVAECTVGQIQQQKITPYTLGTSAGSFGWKADSSGIDAESINNVRVTIPLSLVLTENYKDGRIKTSKATANFIYEVQWNQVDASQELISLDSWRNIVYSYYLPNTGSYLSADEWIRTMIRLYGYTSAHSFFDFENFDNTKEYPQSKDGDPNGLDRVLDGQIKDITDQSLLDFSQTGKPILNTVVFESSFLLENGVKLIGSSNSGVLDVANIFALRNQENLGQQLNFIQNLTVIGRYGTYIDIGGNQSKLILDEKNSEFKTSNLLINNTQSSQASKNAQEGCLFSSGILNVTYSSETSNFSLDNYVVDAAKKPITIENFSSFLSGNMLIASSNFYAGPISEGIQFHSTENDQREINVKNNFMLTNAMLSSQNGEEGFSYFEESGAETTPNQPSTLTLDGANTKMIVKGKSFIDAPKATRRASPTEKVNDKEVKFYSDPDYWNTIVLKNAATLELDYTGVEPFNLSIEKDARMSLKTLPDLEFFDTEFLNRCVSKNQLKGQLVIQTFNQQDATELAKQLTSDKIPVSVVQSGTSAKNGEVTIIRPTTSANKTTTQVITRVFHYLDMAN